MITLPDWRPGDEVTADGLNATNDAVRSLELSVDPNSGLEIRSSSFGRHLLDRRPREMWVKLTAAAVSGSYGGVQQVDQTGGTWADGPKTFTAGDGQLREVNNSTTVPTSPARIVRAWRDKVCWRFEYGACS